MSDESFPVASSAPETSGARNVATENVERVDGSITNVCTREFPVDRGGGTDLEFNISFSSSRITDDVMMGRINSAALRIGYKSEGVGVEDAQSIHDKACIAALNKDGFGLVETVTQSVDKFRMDRGLPKLNPTLSFEEARR